MITPPLLLGAAVIFWGWETGLLMIAIPLGLGLEAARLARWRWEFSLDDFDRLSSATSLLSWAVAGYLFVTTDPSRALTTLFQWLPLLLAPLMLAQAYGNAERVDVTGLFWTFRRRRREASTGRRRTVNLSYLYVVVCLLSAAAANVRTHAFYVGLVVLGAWTLWRIRSERWKPAVWMSLLVVVGTVGFVGHLGLHATQRFIEAMALEWVADLIRRDTDPFRSSTSIGSIGTLKLSDRIVLRVEPRPGGRPPPLLREATYNIYNSPTWLAFDGGFKSILPGGDGTLWTLGPTPPGAESITVSAYLRRGRGVLALPSATSEIRRLTAVGIARNPLGAVKVEEGLGLATYEARFASRVDLDDPPGDLDLRVPAVDALVVARTVEELRLRGRDSSEIRDVVARHFRDKFRYSTFLTARPADTTPLADFMFGSRAGHCEYFATATVLVMRGAGIPARYTTGYSVQEWSTLEKRWIVRTRHAHSWARIYLDGRWQDFDTTPPLWAEEEGKLASMWQPLSDFSSWVGFVFSRWRWGERGEGLTRYVGWLLVPLILILAWRLYFRRQRTRLLPAAGAAARSGVRAGGDSEFYAIEARLNAIGLGRLPAEAVSRWVQRIEAARIDTISTAPLREIVDLHYRYRFDPEGLSAAERTALRARAQDWLARHQTVAALR
jgi:transglutaminase-like putative cysteine protease